MAGADGRLVCGLTGGAIVSVDPDAGEISTIAKTGGRPLGLEPLPDGRLLVCDAHKGLLRVDPSSGSIETLVDDVDGIPLRFCSNAAAQADGTIWFTESTNRFDFEHYVADFLEHRGAGRLFRMRTNGDVQVVLSGLDFANGVALTDDESALIVAETAGYQLSRVSTGAPHRREVIAANLAGLPDNLSRAPGGDFWVAMVTPRNPVLDRLAPRPGLRRLIWQLPDSLRPKPVRTVWVMAFSADGSVVRDLQTERDDFSGVTGVVEHNGRLYLASLDVSALLMVDVPARA